MLADDVLGAQREECISPLPASYYSAFEAIERDPNNELVVCELEGKVVGVLQLTYIPNISRRGSWRALIEAYESLGFAASHEGMKLNLR